MRPASLLGALIGLSSSAALAQSCPLCKLALLNSPEGRSMISSFNSGILLMLAVPFALLLALGIGLVRMRWHSFQEFKSSLGNLFASNPYLADRKTFSGMIWGIGGTMVLVSVLTYALAGWLGAQPGKKSKLPVYGKVSNFTLTDQNGKLFSEKKLSGKIWVADTIFTRCPDECPLLSNHMERVEQNFANDSKVDFVSISVDPRYDRPAVLSRYARHFRAKPGRWFFLTGTPKQIIPIIEKDFFLPIVQDPRESLSPSKPPDIEHSLKFVLVDSKGRIRGYYDGNNDLSLPFLSRDITILEEETTKGL